MSNNTIITISREYGSGGRDIGILLSELLGMPFYDNDLITLASQESGYSEEFFQEVDKMASNSLLYSLSQFGASVNCTSLNDNIFDAQFNAIRKLAERGSCIIVGRCGDYVLRDFPNCTRIFLHSDYETKLKRAIKQYKIPEKSAKDIVNKMDKCRANYYNHHTGQKWGQATNYNICLNTGYVDIGCTAKIIIDYIHNNND